MTERTCSISGCNRPYYGRGWCRLHYQRWWRGRPLTTLIRPTGPLAERFRNAVTRLGPAECWPWSGHSDVHGYGSIADEEGRNAKAHRVAWMLANGPIPPGMCVLHHCDNPGCVNPAHLFLGTRADNNRDRDRKGRVASGESHSQAKLTKAEVAEIRRLWKAGGITQNAIGKRYGVHQSTISLIVRHKLW